MHLHLLIAAPVMLVCLLLQCIVVAVCLRYVHVGSVRTGRRPFWTDVALLAAVMLLTLLCNFAQMAVWAALAPCPTRDLHTPTPREPRKTLHHALSEKPSYPNRHAQGLHGNHLVCYP